jgi:hypothetical protein
MKQIPFTKQKYKTLHLQQVYGLFLGDDEWTNGRKCVAIAGLYPKDFKEKFGKHSFAFQTYRRLYFWAFEHKGEKYFFETANGKGTSIYCAHIKKDEIIEVLNDVLNHFVDREDIQKTVNFIPQ